MLTRRQSLSGVKHRAHAPCSRFRDNFFKVINKENIELGSLNSLQIASRDRTSVFVQVVPYLVSNRATNHVRVSRSIRISPRLHVTLPGHACSSRFVPGDGVATLQTEGTRSLARDNTSLTFSVRVAVELRQRAALAEAQEGLDIVMAQLKDAKARLAGVQKRLAELQKGFDDAVAKKQVCSPPCAVHTT